MCHPAAMLMQFEPPRPEDQQAQLLRAKYGITKVFADEDDYDRPAPCSPATHAGQGTRP